MSLVDEFAFQPIPRACPIGPGSVALIGGIVGGAPCYVLYKDKQEIVIQAPNHDHELPFDEEDPYAVWRWTVKAAKLYAYILEIIQTLLQDVEFGKTNRMFLVKHSKTKQYYLSSKPMTLDRISCTLWAAAQIPIDEVTFTVWGICSDRRGIWDGKEVDITYAWNSSEMARLYQAINGYRAIQGLDLTFEVYGYLIGKDGSIIGLVSEAAWGRMIKPSDRTLIYGAIAEVQRSKCLYRGCLTNRFMIAGNKVRLIDLSLIGFHSDNNRLEQLAELWHWEELEALFGEFETHGPYGAYRIPPLRFTSTYKDLKYIPPLPRIGKHGLPLQSIMLYPGFFDNFGVTPWEGYEVVDSLEDDTPNSIVPARRKVGRFTRRPLLTADTTDPHFAAHITRRHDTGAGGTRRAMVTLSHRRPLLFSPSRHPYYPQGTMGRSRLLATSEDTVSTNSVE